MSQFPLFRATTMPLTMSQSQTQTQTQSPINMTIHTSHSTESLPLYKQALPSNVKKYDPYINTTKLRLQQQQQEQQQNSNVNNNGNNNTALVLYNSVSTSIDSNNIYPPVLFISLTGPSLPLSLHTFSIPYISADTTIEECINHIRLYTLIRTSIVLYRNTVWQPELILHENDTIGELNYSDTHARLDSQRFATRGVGGRHAKAAYFETTGPHDRCRFAFRHQGRTHAASGAGR